MMAMPKKLILQDLDNRSYEVEDIERFMQHLEDFHTNAEGEGDSSLHEENGYYFRVTPAFYRNLKERVAQL
jgi:hypothetical protein